MIINNTKYLLFRGEKETRKRIVGFLSVCLILVMSFGCDSKPQTIIPENTLNVDLTNLSSENQAKYDKLTNIFKEVNEDTVLTFKTTTAIIFDDLGLNIDAAPTSPALNENLIKNQVNASKYYKEENQVLNIESAIDINNELVLKLKPDYFFYSDAIKAMVRISYKALIDSGIKVVVIPQSNYKDIFMLLDVLQKEGFKIKKVLCQFGGC